MEIVSPLSFLIAIHLKPNFDPIFFSIPSLSTISSFSTIKLFSPIANLPPARAILATMFLLHYFNRAVISSFRNPSRARMSISVPLSAVLFNWLNGFMNGFYISSSKNISGFGLIEGSEWKFWLGIICFFTGMVCIQTSATYLAN